MHHVFPGKHTAASRLIDLFHCPGTYELIMFGASTNPAVSNCWGLIHVRVIPDSKWGNGCLLIPGPG